MSKVSDIAYLNFSELAYAYFLEEDRGKTVAELLETINDGKEGRRWRSDDKGSMAYFRMEDCTYRNWSLLDFSDGHLSGFAAALFRSPDGQLPCTKK